MRLRSFAAAVVVVLGLLPSRAGAQVSDVDRATARSLAQEGQDALDRKDFTTAADRFGRARAIVRAPTLLLGLAQAQIGLGKLVTAQETLHRLILEGLPPHPSPPYVKALETAKKEIDTLAPRIPSITIQVTGPGAASASVTVDGIAVPSAALGMKRPVDPGRHVVRGESRSLSGEVVVVVAEGKAESVTLELKPASAPASPPPAPEVKAGPASAAAPATPPEEGDTGSGRRVAAFVTGGVGLAALAIGGVTGGLTLAKKSTILANCGLPGDPTGCNDAGLAAASSAKTLGLVSDVGFAAGGAAVVTAVVLLVTAPKRAPGATGVTVGVSWAGREGAAIGLRGGWR